MTDHLDSVAILVNSYFGSFMPKLARVLKENHGSRIHLYCKSDVIVEQYKNGADAELFDTIKNFQVFMPALRDQHFDVAVEVTTARDFEKRLDTTYNALSATNRHVGRGYALGGFHHPRSGYGDASYEQMLHAYNVQMRFWETELRSNRVTLVIADNKEAAVMARYLGIPYRTLARSRYENLHYWEENEYREAAATQRAFASLAHSFPKTQAAIESLPEYRCGQTFIRRAMKNASWRTVIYNVCYRIARRLYWIFKGYEKAKGYYLIDEIRQQFRQRRAINEMMGPDTVDLDDLEGRTFFFYPLHTEPEQALGQISPEFSYQFEAIASVAKSLPAGVFLAVKEVPNACGRRPDNFYEQIRRFKNVVLVNIEVPGPEIIKRAHCTVTIAGTAGLEAALFGKPVISFGRHNPYNFLSHVFVVRDVAEVPDLVEGILARSWPDLETRREAAIFQQALKVAGFDMGEFDYIDLDSYPEHAPQDAYEKLLVSLNSLVSEKA